MFKTMESKYMCTTGTILFIWKNYAEYGGEKLYKTLSGTMKWDRQEGKQKGTAKGI